MQLFKNMRCLTCRLCRGEASDVPLQGFRNRCAHKWGRKSHSWVLTSSPCRGRGKISLQRIAPVVAGLPCPERNVAGGCAAQGCTGGCSWPLFMNQFSKVPSKIGCEMCQLFGKEETGDFVLCNGPREILIPPWLRFFAACHFVLAILKQNRL